MVPLLHGRFEVTISPYPEILSGRLQLQAEPEDMHYLSTQRTLSKYRVFFLTGTPLKVPSTKKLI